MPNVLILTEVQEAMRARYKAMLLERFPQLTINVVGHHNDVDPYIADIDILLCFSPPMANHVVRDAPKLKWIQALGTGVDNIVDLPSLGKEVLVTNVRGIHGAPVSEATIAFMLSLARDMPRSVRAQEQSKWERWPSALLAGKTVGIFGVGLIAEYLAPICKTFGMTVVGISGSPRETKHFDRVAHRNDLTKVAGDLDFLVVLTPLTPETRNIVGAKVFAGFRFMDHFGLEASYVDFGSPSDVVNGFDIDNDAHAFDAFAVGFLPLTTFDLFGKVGLVSWDSKFDISELDFSQDHDGTDLAYGVGAQFRLGSFAIRGEYEVFDFADNVNMLSVGVSWTFF